MLWYMLDRVSHGQAIAPEWLDELARLGLIQVRREGDDAIVAITPTGERWLDAVDRA
jgi:DNA-binding PadR family transcriptional regulator